ncbi:MFS transporter [Bacillus cereus]|uniref:MFS transporter n=1 Tax=Bacillus TaxID=1386 RepID=UPI000B437BD1|nr:MULTISPECIES: MFS transporter [Bacillus]MBH0348577.1 major facilitator transporter [Bacillus thuringiensis]MDA1907758.1 MFS transporter [Bacillus cereus]MDQ7233724.1 MFS transporter [Bacillus pacificus]MDQ7241221.1 MFS transporter [Bacillus pacificus]OTY01186.1 MFS transporter [Bacillus thuringiensis serovar muju]
MIIKNIETHSFELTQRFVLFMAVICGFTVANVYINQTLLVSIAHTFHVSETRIGIVATVTQVGYALGNLFIVPLGDILERKKLILILLSLICINLALAAFSTDMTWLIVANFILGFVTIIPQIVIPFVSQYATDQNRGQILGNVSIGLVCGILGARLISGFIDIHFGWRTVYGIFFISTFILILLVKMYFPKGDKTHHMQYKKLLFSFIPLLLQEKMLRKACLSQGMVFGAFSVFWTTLIFLLTTHPYHYGSSTVGLIGLVGIVGAFATPIIGRIIDKKGAIFANALCTSISFFSFLLFLFSGYWLPGLIVGALLLTAGTQANQVACQAHLFQLHPEKRSSLNGIYMVATFLGGSIGSYFGLLVWSKWQWTGVCILGISMISITLISFIKVPHYTRKEDVCNEKS